MKANLLLKVTSESILLLAWYSPPASAGGGHSRNKMD